MNFKEFRESRYNPQPNSSLDRDIIEHLPYLEYLAGKCRVITETGLNNAHSTAAFLSGCKGKVISYDIVRPASVDIIRSIESLPCDWYFIQHDTADPELVIEETDFLFIDSLHTYEHCKKELRLHGNKSRRWIGFHDTVAFGNRGQDNSEPGLLKAIEEFTLDCPLWSKYAEFWYNNGIIILEKRQ